MQLPSLPGRYRDLLTHPVALATAFALVARIWIILRFPNNYAFDGWQRWAGREHVLVQDWLPVVQLVIFVVAKLGGGVQVTRIVLSVITALGVGAGTLSAEAMGGRPAAWVFGTLAGFGPFLVWTTLMYQEGVYVTVLFAGLAVALQAGVGLSAVRQKGRSGLLAADLIFGLLPLIRYEGWPVAVLYMLWRRSPRALVACWGAAVWVGIKLLGIKGFYPSPVDYFEDWRDLGARFDVGHWVGEIVSLGEMALRSGGLLILVLGVAAAGMCWRARGVPFVALILGGQVLATLAWVAGLETGTLRMIVLPVVFAALAASVGVAELWTRFARLRPLFTAGLIAIALFGLKAAADQVDSEQRRVRYEVVALGRMQACQECRWWIVPRARLGARSRDDGCEILQGMTRMKHGETFWCEPWLSDLSEVDRAARQSQTDGVVRWSPGDHGGGQYVVTYNPINPLLSH